MGGKGAWNRTQWVCSCLSLLNMNNLDLFFLVSVLAFSAPVVMLPLKPPLVPPHNHL
jgi:hypothetical protein